MLENRQMPESTEKTITVQGEEIPMIRYHFYSGANFKGNLCLKPFLGYIPIEKVTCYRDIFCKHKYCKDDLEWIKPYDVENACKEDQENVKKLIHSLGKHWK